MPALAAREQTNSDLSAKKDVIDARLDQVHAEMRGELTKLSEMVTTLGRSSAENFGQVTSSLQAHGEVTNALATSTQSLREALANPKARGQWGERMAEDVLRLAGFIEHVNYEKQTAVDGGTGRPDFTFTLPKGHVLYMDVKFPLAAYLRYLEAGTDAERDAPRHVPRDVRLRVKELADRDYPAQSGRPAVDYALLFLPNETSARSSTSTTRRWSSTPSARRWCMCSPLTLFAFLGVIRQAFDNFMIEQTSDEILQAARHASASSGPSSPAASTRCRTGSTRCQREFEQLTGPRRRQLEQPLQQLEALRLAEPPR